MSTERIVNTFLDLVKIDSPSKQEAQVADYIETVLKKLDVEFWRDDAGAKIGGNTGNLYVRMPAKDSKAPAVLFSAHMDTVMPGLGIKPILENGIIKSDGSTILGADDKAGITAILEMLRSLHESKAPHGPVEVIFDVAEEIGLQGAYQVALDGMQAKCAFVLDAEDMDFIVYRAPSANRVKYEIEGIAAHAGMCPEKGISAIEVFSEAVSKMQLGRLNEDSTANIGTVEGGTATNVVAPKLIATAEVRSHSTDFLEEQTKHMAGCFESAVENFTKSLNGAVLKPVFHHEVQREFTAMEISLDSLPYQLASQAGLTLGIEMKPLSIGGGTNANVYNEKGLPAVVIGCGMRSEHTTDEHIAVKDLETSTKLCLAIVAQNHKMTK